MRNHPRTFVNLRRASFANMNISGLTRWDGAVHSFFPFRIFCFSLIDSLFDPGSGFWRICVILLIGTERLTGNLRFASFRVQRLIFIISIFIRCVDRIGFKPPSVDPPGKAGHRVSLHFPAPSSNLNYPGLPDGCGSSHPHTHLDLE